MENNKTGFLSVIRVISDLYSECDTVEDVQEMFSGLTQTLKGLGEKRVSELQQIAPEAPEASEVTED